MSVHSCRRWGLGEISLNLKHFTLKSRFSGYIFINKSRNCGLLGSYIFSIVNITSANNKTSIVWQDVFDYHERVGAHQDFTVCSIIISIQM